MVSMQAVTGARKLLTPSASLKAGPDMDPRERAGDDYARQLAVYADAGLREDAAGWVERP